MKIYEKAYQYILAWAVKGLDKLSETYNKADKNNIRHTLALYRNVLDLKADEIFYHISQHRAIDFI